MLDFIDDHGFVHDLFAFVVEMALRYARAQIEAGVDQIGVGDAPASLIGPNIYEEFVWPYEKKLVDGLHALGATVRLHICGDIHHLLPRIARLDCEIVDIDSPVPIAEARAKLGPNPILLGNIDPVRILRNGTPELVTTAIGQCHREAGDRYAVAAGCEVPPDTPVENVHALLRYAQSCGART
jgi:MtaA/CmuA family methyltransferase